MTAATLLTLTNPEVLAINQDALDEQARLLNTSATPRGKPPTGTVSTLTWVGALAGADSWTVLVVNNESATQMLRFDVGLLPRPESSGKLAARDLWERRDLPGAYSKGDILSKSVDVHDCFLLRFERVPRDVPCAAV